MSYYSVYFTNSLEETHFLDPSPSGLSFIFLLLVGYMAAPKKLLGELDWLVNLREKNDLGEKGEREETRSHQKLNKDSRKAYHNTRYVRL